MQQADVLPSPLWLANWSDSEDADFRAACVSAGVAARVLRGPALGDSVGTRRHRFRSWPSYISLAIRGLRLAAGAPIVAWQPLAGAIAGYLRRGSSPPLLVLNPLLDLESSSTRQRIALGGVARADRVLFFSRAALEAGVVLGLERAKLEFVPLGVRVSREWRPPTGDYVLAAGRELRDWTTLARAVEGLEMEVRVLGARGLKPGSSLRILPQVGRRQFLELAAGARALVVPLMETARAAGQLTVLDAMSVGRAVVATRAAGTEDYVTDRRGILVPPGDPDALRAALRRVYDIEIATTMGRAAFEAARGPLSLERFVASVDGEARSI